MHDTRDVISMLNPKRKTSCHQGMLREHKYMSMHVTSPVQTHGRKSLYDLLGDEKTAAVKLLSPNFNPLEHDEQTLCTAALSMLSDLGILVKYGLSASKMLELLDLFPSSYRDNPYHNFKHGASSSG